MKPALTFTFDLEDHRPDEALPRRYDVITERVLQFLDDHKIRASIFVVGTLAQENPVLIKEAQSAGHEIAHHSFDHTVLTKQTPDEFRDHTKRGKDILEDITGEAVLGFRAPVFSLTPKTLWAIDILKALGFKYSSSILPASNPLHGFPDAPSSPFQWPDGLIEIPAPIGKIGPKFMPYLGGFYLRYLPFGMIEKQLRNASSNQNLWTYCHPYDFDGEEKNWRIKGASTPVSLLLWMNRKNTFNKLEKLISVCDILPPFQEQDFGDDLPVFNPPT